jgi:GDP-D-mannose 3',5'-epimerase
MEMNKVVVAGAGGFIGGHLVSALSKKKNHLIRAVDIKPLNEWYQVFPDTENLVLDLREKENCYQAVKGFNEVYNLAADMGGMGFIETHKAACMISVLINTHLLMAAKDMGVDRYFYSSSACVYNGEKQTDPDNPGLKESDAYPALAEDGYGWEKLFSERMCRHFREDYGLTTRVARFHNVYGPFGTYEGGREKAPAAICRKVIEAQLSGKHEIVIWGDGLQTRSFMYIDDCINALTDIVENIAGIKLQRKYDLDAPKGVRGRNSDNALIKEYLNWEPSISLREGMKQTYNWIYSRMTAKQA